MGGTHARLRASSDPVTYSGRCGSQQPATATSSKSPTEPPGPALSQYCLSPQEHPQPVHFWGTNGQVVGAGSTGVVIANESDNNVCPWQPLVRQQPAAGRCRVLVYFFASAGSSDVLSAAAALRRQGARLALVGAKEKKLVLRPGTKHGVEYLKGELAA